MPREPEELAPHSIRFIMEQDGLPERSLKEKIHSFLTSSNFKGRAYLAQVDYGTAETFNVALCIRVLSGDTDALKAGVADIFRDMFRVDEHLDVILISANDELSLSPICRP